MKISISAVFAPCLLALSLALAGCCNNVQCECVTSGLTIQYVSGSTTNCPERFQESISVNAYNASDNSLIGPEKSADNFECNVFLPYAADRYWIIEYSNLSINDTIRIADPQFTNNSGRCCDCGDVLTSGNFTVNGDAYSDPLIQRNY